MAVSDEDVAVGRHDHVRRLIEGVLGSAGNTRLAERHQHFSFSAEFDDDVTLAALADLIGDPDVAVTVDRDAVRHREYAGTEALQVFAGSIEFDHRRHVVIRATVAAAALGRPQVTVTIEVNGADRAPAPAIRQFGPAILHIRIRRILGPDCTSRPNAKHDYGRCGPVFTAHVDSSR